MKTDLCIIILNYNDSKTTSKLVDELLSFKIIKFKVIIVDNQSIDDSYEMLRKKYCRCNNVDIIISKKNGGYSYGNNYGIKFAIKKYNPKFLVISNPDIMISEATLVDLLSTFDIDDEIAMCAPVMRNLRGGYKVVSQLIPTYMDDIEACFGKMYDKCNRASLELYNDNEHCVLTEMLPGSFFAIRSDYFSQINFFDENVFLFCEERIIGRKLKDLGYKIILRSDLFFIHAHSTTINKHYNTFQTYRKMQESRLYYQKEYNRISKSKEILFRISSKVYLLQIFLLQIINGCK